MQCACGYNTIDRSNYRRHRRSCRATKENAHETLRIELDRVRSDLRMREIELTACHRKIAKLEDRIARLKCIPSTTMRDCNIFVTNIFPYATEATMVIAPEQVHELLRTVTPSESVPRFVQLKHFSGPLATRNIYLPNRRGNTVLVVESSEDGKLRWVHRDRKNVINDMLERNLDELRTNYRADLMVPWYNWFANSGLSSTQRKSTPAWKEQIAKLDLILVNHQRRANGAEVLQDGRDTNSLDGTEDE